MTKAREPKHGEYWYVTDAKGRTGRVEPGLLECGRVWLTTWPKSIPMKNLRFISRCRIPPCPADCVPVKP